MSSLSNISKIFSESKSLTDVLNSFKCISEDYSNLNIKNIEYSSYNYNECSEEEKEDFFNNELQFIECLVTDSIYEKSGGIWNWKDIYDLLCDEDYAKIDKIKRKMVFSTSSTSRPIGEVSFSMWNGLQIIDLDIKNEALADKMKVILFEELKKFHWFLGICKSASKKSLHVWTKITPISIDPKNKRIEYLCNFRHKYSYIYIILLNYVSSNSYNKSDIVEFMDMAMAKPQQGIFISSDNEAILNMNFQDLRLDVNFESAFDTGISSIDWISHEDLKGIFSKLEWFNNDTFDDINNVDVENIKNTEYRDINKSKGRKHYKHNQRWQIANTLTALFGPEKAYELICSICKDTSARELMGDIKTASIHNKPISIWAVKELNQNHGFNIEVKVNNEKLKNNIETIIKEVNEDKTVDYVHSLTENNSRMIMNIKHNQYLGNIKDEIIDNLGKITLLEAGAGYGKTEMIKALKDKTLLILPFTSTIKAKVECSEVTEDWLYYYGNKKPTLQEIMSDNSISMTIDKFAKLNLFELNAADFKYIVIDESHLLFTSSFREVMSPAIQRLANCKAKVIMMTGTPTGELLFFPNIKHIKVIKEDFREKEFQIHFHPTKTEQKLHMCVDIAKDIKAGKKILFPTNKGNLYFEQIIGLIQKAFEDLGEEREITYFYYKKSNTGEKSMDDINIEKTFGNNDIIFCTSFLSVGVDICDKFDFRVYFSELWISQDIEQFANRIRNNNLYVSVYLPMRDSNDYPINYNITNSLDLSFDKEDLILIRDFIRTCNDLLDRNSEEYKYNPLIQNILSANRYLKYDENDCKYYIDETAYKLKIFEDRYVDYGKQLQVLIKGMQNFGYRILQHMNELEVSSESKNKLEEYLKNCRNFRLSEITRKTLNFVNQLTDDNIEIYKEIKKGNYELFKSEKYEDFRGDNNLYVESIEVLEKNVPLVLSLYKFFDCDTIKEIYKFCVNKRSGNIVFSAIDRIISFMVIDNQRKKKKLDIPILRFIQDTDKWVKSNNKRTTTEISEFLDLYACKYANNVTDVVRTDVLYLKKIRDYLERIFNIVVFKGHSKNCIYNLRMFESIWTKKDDLNLLDIYGDQNTMSFFMGDLLEKNKENEEESELEAPDFVVTSKLEEKDIQEELPNIVHKDFDYYKYSEDDNSNNRFLRKQENTNRVGTVLAPPTESIFKEVETEENKDKSLFDDIPF